MSVPKSLAEVKTVKESNSVKESLLRDIIQKSLQSDNPLIQKALKQEQAFRAQTEKELDKTFDTIQKLMAERNEEETTKIKNATLERLNTDLELIKHLNTALGDYRPKDSDPKDYTAEDHSTCTYPAKFNKMNEALTGATALVKTHFKDIFCDNTLPLEYSFRSNAKDVTILGNNPYSIYGDSKGTFLKTAALNVVLTCTGETRLQKCVEIDSSALVHVTALPANLNLTKLDESFSKFTYLFSDDTFSHNNITQGLAFVHSGYAFGGHRDTASRYASGTKLYGPEDCSSWIAKFYGSPIQFSTLDQLYVYRLSVLKNFQQSLGIVPSEYINTPIVSTMTDLFEPVIIKDPQRDIQPGQIYVHRTYDLNKDKTMEGAGSGGHTGVVLDFISAGKDSNVVIMAYGRNMPNMEGFGIDPYPYVQENRKVMLFSAKSQRASGSGIKEDSKSSIEKDPEALVSASETGHKKTNLLGNTKL